jgi:hypothetical protein
VPRAETVRHRNAEISDYAHYHFLKRVVLRGSLAAIQHLAEDDASNIF